MAHSLLPSSSPLPPLDFAQSGSASSPPLRRLVDATPPSPQPLQSTLKEPRDHLSTSTTNEHTPTSANSTNGHPHSTSQLTTNTTTTAITLSGSEHTTAHSASASSTFSSSSSFSSSTTSSSTSAELLTAAMQKMTIDEERPHYNSNDLIAASTASFASTSSSSSASSSSTSPPPSSTTSSSSSSSKKKAISYAAERVIGNGSFGVVYQATVIDTGETVAIKKVLQDRRFKNRELEIMSALNHPNVVALRHCFYSKGEKPEEVYLNLVMEYIPETIHRTLRNHTKANKLVPILYTKVYLYQIARALAYIHSQGICHRDIKPQNLLLNPKSHEVKLCDFGSAKSLHPGEPNVSYICSRYYRAPELVFEATEYTSMIDVWSLGCVFVELLIGNPLFPGDSGVGQLIEIIKVLGSPTREEVLAMNPTPTSFRFPHISPQPWSKVFRTTKVPPAAIDLASRWLRYKPTERMDPFDSLSHPFFDELREEGVRMPNGKELPDLFDWKESERERMVKRGGGLYERMTPAWYRRKRGEAVQEEVGGGDKAMDGMRSNGATAAEANGHRGAGAEANGAADMERDGT